ncbi:putative secreted effector protein [Blumeria graminis f. sp. tritici 96224]|uniref:Putative secreted effector protein n=1 Tax=Blumeria graminis f. sp. tritici 96224 TaxID=1268274 RepID=A0A656KQD2_BLUGR|nr:putative secreted effector protein [Blumeria graminis f. sp. tritici 96224]
MKFISTATTGALACISLLVPTAYGNREYKCESGDPLLESQVFAMETERFTIPNSHEHPAIPTLEPHKTYFSMRSLNPYGQFSYSFNTCLNNRSFWNQVYLLT